MSDWELIDDNPEIGLRKYIRAGDEPDSVDVRYEGYSHTIIDENKASQNESFDRRSDMWHAAKIPAIVMYEWLTKFGVNAWEYANDPDVRKKVNSLLNSNEYRYLRVNHFII